MAKEEKKAPKLRFNGYTNDWERKELNNILKINSGRDYKQLNSGNIPVYGTGGYMLSVNDKLSDTDAVGIGRKGTIDKPLYLKAPFWTVDTLFYCTSKENSDVKFIYLLFQIINWKRYDESTGVPSLSKNTISNIKTYVPKIKEQDYISKLFFSLDNTLQLHERKCEELILIKKALLQKLFPKKDKVRPEVRYKNFSDAWKQRKLGDYLSIPAKEPITDINKLKLMTLKLNLEGITLAANRETLKLGSTKYYKRHEGQLLYGKQNFFHGSIALIPKEAEGYATSGDVPALNISNINSKYLVDYISRPIYFETKEALATGTGSKRIHEKTLLNFKIAVPSLEEQSEISDFIAKYTALIALHQSKLEKLKKMKKFLLQNMFI